MPTRRLLQNQTNHQLTKQASGNIGTSILHALLTNNTTNTPQRITIISRSTSTSNFPNLTPSNPTTNITIRKGPYSDPSFLASAFQGCEVAVFALSFMAMGEQGKLIEAAVKAGVGWILPTEYAGDGLNGEMVEGVPLFWPKREARRQIEELGRTYGGLKWIGVATGPWLEAVSFIPKSLSFCSFCSWVWS
jgi:uncharacterized protein YbjT (DUF2867 family)